MVSSNTELVASTRLKEAKSTHMGDSIISTISSMYFRFAHLIQKVIAFNYFVAVSEVVLLTFELRRS